MGQPESESTPDTIKKPVDEAAAPAADTAPAPAESQADNNPPPSAATTEG